MNKNQKISPHPAKRSLADSAYERIYQKLMTLEYRPGESLEEKRLMEDLDMGRTPIREALLRLAGEMMLVFESKKGFIVRPITLQATRAVFEALEILELGVAKLAVRRNADDSLIEMVKANQALYIAMEQYDVIGLVETNHRFHMAFAGSSGNDYLIRALYQVRCEANRLAYLSYGMETDTPEQKQKHYKSVLDQHETIMTFLKNKEEVRLQKLLLDHLNIFKDRIIRYLTH